MIYGAIIDNGGPLTSAAGAGLVLDTEKM